MPAEQHGQPYQLGPKRWGLRYYDRDGARRRKSGFQSRSEALAYYRDVLRPQILGKAVPQPDRTLSAFVEEYLAAHAVGREPSTIRTLRERLRYATKKLGDVQLRDLERRAAEIAAWQSTLPAGSRWHIVKALRQALDAAVRWGLIEQNPAKLAGPNPKPKRAELVPFTLDEVDALAKELGATWGPFVIFAAETGLRPSEWIALERRDVHKADGVVVVQRTYAKGALRDYGKTARSRRRVPLSARALAALEALPPRLDTPLLFAGAKGGHLNLHNWRAAAWYTALEAAGLERCGPYRLRHTFAANALAAGLGLYELARFMGTSVQMIDETYGHLVKGAEDVARGKLDALAERLGQDRANAADQESGS